MNFRRLITSFVLIAAPLSLTACVAITLVPAGDYAVGQDHLILGQAWNDISVMAPGLPKQAKLLSIDGPLLNRLYVVSALPSGEALVRAPSKETPTPVTAANMSSRERVEFVVDSIAAMGYQHVESDNLRPAKFGAIDGVRVDVTAKTKEGLDIRGTALIAASGNKLHLILYLAPAEYYYQASLPEVESIMSNARLS